MLESYVTGLTAVVLVTLALLPPSLRRASASSNSSVTASLDAPLAATMRNRGFNSSVVTGPSVTIGTADHNSSSRQAPNCSTSVSDTLRTSSVISGCNRRWPEQSR